MQIEDPRDVVARLNREIADLVKHDDKILEWGALAYAFDGEVEAITWGGRPIWSSELWVDGGAEPGPIEAQVRARIRQVVVPALAALVRLSEPPKPVVLRAKR